MAIQSRRTDLTAVVLAGGKGTRIAGMFPDLPKPMVPAAGAPFLFWVTGWLIKNGVTDVVYSIGHQAGAVEAWRDRLHPNPGISLRCQREETALGTGGAVRNCLGLCAETLIVTNGDTLLVADLRSAIDRFFGEKLDGVLLAIEVPDTSRYGSLRVERGILRAFAEKVAGSGLVYGGTLIIKRALLREGAGLRGTSLETDILPGLLAEGRRLGVVASAAPFLDIGTPQTVQQATSFIDAHRSALSADWGIAQP